MKRVRSLIGALLVLVMVGSIVSPALAVSTEQKVPANTSKTVTRKSVAVIEVIGIEKNEILAKALRNKNVEKLLNILKMKGYSQNIAKARVSKIYTKYGIATLITIPFNTRSKNKVAGIVITILNGHTKTYAVELQRKNNQIDGKVYYLDPNGNIHIESVSSFLACLWACIGWEIPACALTCAACADGGLLACLACAACVGKGACCVGKCGKQEWGDPFCAIIDIECQLGDPVACAVYSGCEGYC